MENMNYELLTVDGKPALKMRYYKARTPQKGIIVFVHGVSHGAWCWINFVKFFTRCGYACFAINLRGHGDDKRFGKGTLPQYVNDVERCIIHCKKFCENKKIPYSKPIVLGHSMGGAIVENYISRHSGHVSSAVLFAPVTADGMGMDAFRTTLSKTGLYTEPTVLEWKPNKFLDKSNFFVAKTDNQNFIPRITDKEELAYYDRQLCRESPIAMLGLIRFRLNKPGIPVFVTGSDKDAYFPTESLIQTANFYNTKPMVLRGLCHDMMLDPQWEQAALSVLEFIHNPEDLQRKPKEFIDALEAKIYPDK
jgi:Lysophospholipase